MNKNKQKLFQLKTKQLFLPNCRGWLWWWLSQSGNIVARKIMPKKKTPAKKQNIYKFKKQKRKEIDAKFSKIFY